MGVPAYLSPLEFVIHELSGSKVVCPPVSGDKWALIGEDTEAVNWEERVTNLSLHVSPPGLLSVRQLPAWTVPCGALPWVPP